MRVRRVVFVALMLALATTAASSLCAQQSTPSPARADAAVRNAADGTPAAPTNPGPTADGLHPVRLERRTEMPAAGSASRAAGRAEGGSNGQEAPVPVTVTHDVREGYVRIRTSLTHPQPNVRRALGTGPIDLRAGSPGHDQLQALLRRPARDFKFDEMPLRDALAMIRDTHELPMQLDIKTLEEAGIDIDIPVTADVADVSLRSALRLMLRDLDLAYLVQHEVVLITTLEQAEENPILKVYPLAPEIDPPAIIDLVQATIEPTSWDTAGGPGAIRPLDGESGTGLVVSQTEEVHEVVATCIDAITLDELGGLGEPAAIDPAALPTRLYVIDEPALAPELEKKLVGLCNAALGDAADPAAKVSTLGRYLVVQSRSRAFQNYAADVVRCVNGRLRTTTDYLGMGGQDLPVSGR